jgi:transcriptional regulator with XRE-family HTH domain
MATIDQAEGELFRKARDVVGFTQQQLARESGVDQSSISRLERGDFNGIRAGRLNAIRKVLKLPLPSLGLDPKALTLACCQNPRCISHVAIESDALYLMPHFVKVKTGSTAYCRYCPSALEQSCACGEALVDAVRCPHCRAWYIHVIDEFKQKPNWARQHNEDAHRMLEQKRLLQAIDSEPVYEVVRNDDRADHATENRNNNDEGVGIETITRLAGRPR